MRYRCCNLINSLITGFPPDPTPPDEPLPFLLLFDDPANFPVADPNDVADWNTLLVDSGGAFTSVVIDGAYVNLYGANNTVLLDNVFNGNINLIGVSDQSEQVTSIGGGFCEGAVNLFAVSLNGLTSIPTKAFKGCDNLSVIEFNNATSIGLESFYLCFSLPSANFPLCTTIGDYSFGVTSAMTDANFPLCTTIGQDALNASNLSGTIDFTAVTQIGSACFSNCLFSSITLDNLTTVGIGSEFNNCANLTTLSLPALTAFGDYICQNCTALTSFSAPLVTVCGFSPGAAACFNGCTSLALVNLASCTDLGGSVGDDVVFNNTNNINLTVPAALATIDGGNPDGDIVYLTTNYPGSNIIYV